MFWLGCFHHKTSWSLVLSFTQLIPRYKASCKNSLSKRSSVPPQKCPSHGRHQRTSTSGDWRTRNVFESLWRGKQNWLLWNIKRYHHGAFWWFNSCDGQPSKSTVFGEAQVNPADSWRLCPLPQNPVLGNLMKNTLVLPQIFPIFQGHRLGFGPQFCSKFREDVHLLHLARTSAMFRQNQRYDFTSNKTNKCCWTHGGKWGNIGPAWTGQWKVKTRWEGYRGSLYCSL